MIADKTCPVCATVTRFGWVSGANDPDPASTHDCRALGTIVGSTLCNFGGWTGQDLLDAGVEA